jgi:hypothetical protein
MKSQRYFCVRANLKFESLALDYHCARKMVRDWLIQPYTENHQMTKAAHHDTEQNSNESEQHTLPGTWH